jgi:transketolase
MTSRQIDLPGLATRARRLRATCIKMSHEGKEGHLGGSLSCLDILVALYHVWLKVSPDAPKDPNRDRLFFSKGHACSSLYAVLADRGFVTPASLATYNQAGSPYPLHSCQHNLPVLEMSAGSLGHGLGIAVGAAYGLTLDNNPARVVALLSDGECNEGSVWEAAMLAKAQGLERLIAIVDYNGTQSIGFTDELMGHTSIEEKFRAFGWNASTIDGNDIGAVVAALDAVRFDTGKPTAIVARTTKGVSFMENQILWHYRVPSADEVAKAFDELGAEPIY